MRILIVATKPPWPPRDGGRLVLATTIDALVADGHEVAVVAPTDVETPPAAPPGVRLDLVTFAPRGWLSATFAALRSSHALTVERHASDAVSGALVGAIAQFRPDVVHAEQLQTMANLGAALLARVPIVLRMQNVESSLWRQTAQARRSWRWLAFEARRIESEEAAASVLARIVALTARDAAALRALGCTDAVAVAPPFPAELPPGAPVDGAPAVAVAGSGGWWPNRQGTRWLLDEVVPHLDRGTRVHVYGGERIDCNGVQWHAPPDDARDAFPAGAIAAVPLLLGSGIRMRILEAWARGLPVVATSIAAAGLDVESDRELVIADTPAAFAAAIARVAADPAFAARLVDAGRAYLRARHDPQTQARALVDEYRAARTLDP